MAAYKKLSSQRHHGSNYSRLWLAEDHVLLVTTTGYTEEYRRFFFADIQAVFIRKTKAGTVANWALVCIAIVLAVLGIFVSEAFILCVVVAGFCLLFAGFNALLGPTCLVEIQTAVARQELPPLHRLRPSKKIVARLLPLVTAAQGETTPEQLATITAVAASPAGLP
jgi:hypothetical protein